MGQRANLIIVENREYRLYYSHWCANTITRDLFWGPDHAVRFVRIQREVDLSGWLDDVWAEGAAVIDRDNHVLLLYGGDDVLYDVPLRRIYLEMLLRVWAEWEVRWAHEGIAEIADYVDYPRIKVLSAEKNSDNAACSLAPPPQLDWTDLVGSFRLADGRLRLYPLAGDVEFYLLAGPNLVEESRRSAGLEFVPLDKWIADGFPTGGFHVDLQAQTVDYWTAKDIPDIPNRVPARWPGWSVTWHRDHFEYQFDATAGTVRFPVRSTEFLQQQLKEMLLRVDGRSGVDTILQMTEIHRGEAKHVQINPWALRDDRLTLDVGERQRILAIALNSASAT